MIKDFDSAAAEYVLGTLSASDRAEFEASMANDKKLSDAVSFWQAEFSAMDDEFSEVAPKDDIWASISREIGGAGDAAANDNMAASLRRWKFATFASVAAASLLGLFVVTELRQANAPTAVTAPKSALVAQLQGDIDGLLLTATYSPADGDMKIDVEGMPETDTEPEIWVKTSDQNTVSLGQIGRSGISRMTVPVDLRAHLKDGSILILTMEPPSKLPHSKPSGDAVALGRAALIT